MSTHVHIARSTQGVVRSCIILILLYTVIAKLEAKTIIVQCGVYSTSQIKCNVITLHYITITLHYDYTTDDITTVHLNYTSNKA